jgi:hypothetical protein
MMKLSSIKKPVSVVMAAILIISLTSGIFNFRSGTAKAASVEGARFLQLYAQLKDPASGYFSAEGIPYHAVETLLSEAPNYGHMTTSEAYSYWMWLEVLYGYNTGDWSKLEAAWDNMEKYIIPINEGDGVQEQPTMSNYNPNSPATYASELAQPDLYPSALNGKYSPGKDPLDAELKSTYGNNQTYLMHWLVDVDNWYGFGNLLNPGHTAAYVNTFQRGVQESVWEAVPHPSQDDKSFGKTNEGFMSLFTKENNVPSAQWRYTDATDADARAVQAMYWAKDLGYTNTVYLNKAKKMGDYLRYGMYDKYFQKIGSAADGTPEAGTGKDSSQYLLAWYTAWGGGLGTTGNWAWRIGASHAHQGYQNVVAAYALSTADGGLIPASATAGEDWGKSLTRQLEFYNWLQSSEGAIAGGATNSYDGSYSAYPSGTSTFYGMAYEEAPVYHDPPSNNWFGMQAWSVERVAELYYILASSGDTTSANFKMAKQVVENWIDWSTDYAFAGSRPVTDAAGYYLDTQGNRILGGDDPQVATVSAPGEFWIPGNVEWNGQPDTWGGFSSFTGNSGLKAVTKDPGQDTGVLGSYIKALTFFAAGNKAEHGNYTALGGTASQLAKSLLDTAWGYNDGVGITSVSSPKRYIFQRAGQVPSAKAIQYRAVRPCLPIRLRAETEYMRVIPMFFPISKMIPSGVIWKASTIARTTKQPRRGTTAHLSSPITVSGHKWTSLQPMRNMTVLLTTAVVQHQRLRRPLRQRLRRQPHQRQHLQPHQRQHLQLHRRLRRQSHQRQHLQLHQRPHRQSRQRLRRQLHQRPHRQPRLPREIWWFNTVQRIRMPQTRSSVRNCRLSTTEPQR